MFITVDKKIITSSDDTFGINVDNLDKLVLNINDCAEKIKEILIKYDDLVQENIQYFDCEYKESFLTIHNENKYNFSIFEKNVLNYAKDLLRVKTNYQKVVDNSPIIFTSNEHEK